MQYLPNVFARSVGLDGDAPQFNTIKFKGGIMAGTKSGGKLAAEKNKSKYGADFYAKIGAKGGRLGRTGGFYANRELARQAGTKGGRISRRITLVAA